MAVEVNRVVEWDRGLDHDVHPFAHLGEGQHEIPCVGGGHAIRDDAHEGGVFVVGHEGCAREVPFEEVVYGVERDVFDEFDVAAYGVEFCDGDEGGERLVDAFADVVVFSGGGDGGVVGAGVADDAFDVVGLDGFVAGVLVVGAHPVGAGWLVGFDEDHVALADVDAEGVGFVGFDVSEVHVDDFELVAVDVEFVR